MSVPSNPLNIFSTYQLKHVVAAFRTTNSAESTELTDEIGVPGERVGDGVVIANEFMDTSFTVHSFVWQWSSSGHLGPKTTEMVGNLQIASRTGGYFVDWLRKNVALSMGESLSNLVFSIKTYFLGTDKSGDNDRYEVLTGPQLLFNVLDIYEEMNSKDGSGLVNLSFVAPYNTTSQLSNISKPYQITLTHKDGDLNNSPPETFGASSGIVFRGQEDSDKIDPREQRLEKSKPMKTLKEAFEAFEIELNQQAYVHKRQVQDWLSFIRDDYEFKINPPPRQKRGDKLPIEFKVVLDPVYENYSIDNRNLPFEQTDENGDIPGVTSIPFRSGSTIVEMADKIMRYSIKAGQEYATTSSSFNYKINLSHVKDDKKITVFVKIKKILAPFNSVSHGDTGPGDGALNFLEFEFKSGELADSDIIYLNTLLNSDYGFIPLEMGDKRAVFGNREAITGERIPVTASGRDYFKTMFSGLRTPLVPYLNNGLEDPVAASNLDIDIPQCSIHDIMVKGNPDLMWDLHRKPSDSAQLESSGAATLYKIPESYPMYLKINIYLKPDAVIGIKRDNIPQLHYFSNYYEISGIINNMSGGKFYQYIKLNKTDDFI